MQTSVFSFVVCFWFRTRARFTHVVASVSLALVFAMSGLGVLAATAALPAP